MFNKYHGSDLAQDVRDQYIDALRRGKDNSEATKQLMVDYEFALFDEDDAPIFWIALANIQWDMGRLEETVKHNAVEHIEKELEINRNQANDTVGAESLINVLTEFRYKLLSPQPQKKQIRQYRLFHTDWEMGDVFAYCLNGEGLDYPAFHNMYVYFVVKGTETWYPGHTIPVVYVYWAASKELLNLATLQKQKYLPQFYKPIVYRNNPGMKIQYSLGLLCTSARVIPKKRLTYLGNIGSIKAIDKEDPSAYEVAWKNFDKYMIENFIAWDKTNI